MDGTFAALLNRLDGITGYRLFRGRFVSAGLSPIARAVKDARLTSSRDDRLAGIERVLQRVVREGVEGCFVECGVALGGSGIVIATLMPRGRTFYGYDPFGTTAQPHAENLYERAVQNFAQLGQPVDGRRVILRRGVYEETLDPPPPVAFAHIASGSFGTVKLCLGRIFPRLATGGYVVLDDYHESGGCRRAVDEFVERRAGVIEVIARWPVFVFRTSSPPSTA